jgi:uncharacterized membrane protein
MVKIDKDRILHGTFRASILFKGIDGVLELIGGLVLAFVSSAYVSRVVEAVFRHELAQDPADFIANYLVHVAQTLSISSQMFGATYLLVHGAIKVTIVVSLWREDLKAYPIAGVVLVLFVIYQVFRLFSHFSALLLLLTVVDVVIIALLRFEYLRLKAGGLKAGAA